MKDKEQKHVGNTEMVEENKLTFSIKSIDSIVFECFKTLRSANEPERLKAGLELLQHFTKIQNNDKKEKEIKYAIRRFISGVGASTTQSRAGFFTTFVGFLKIISNEDICVKNVFDVTEKVLHVSGAVVNKEDADAIVGQILVCGALIHSHKIFQATGDELKRLIKILTSASKHKTYHNSLAYSFITELVKIVNPKDFGQSIWPILGAELNKKWSKQTINTVHCLIEVINKFPEIINKEYLEKNFGGKELLNSQSRKYFFKFFWGNTLLNTVTHPAYESFSIYLANCKELNIFWLNEIDSMLEKPNKLQEIETLKILTDIFINVDPKKIDITKLLTNNFIKMLITSLKDTKFKKNDTLKAFYNDFFDSLQKLTTKIDDDHIKVNIIRKLILHPGLLCIEKFTTNRIVHQIINCLGENGIKELYDLYKNILLDNFPKNPFDKTVEWLNIERQTAGYMLQTLIAHKNVHQSYEWRGTELKFMMKISLFYINDKHEIVSKQNDLEILTNELIIQMKNIFYASLQSKVRQLQDEKEILLGLVEVCHQVLQRKTYNKYLRNRIDENILKIWNEMYQEVVVTKRNKSSNDKLHLVFHILLLHMGLQLFREPDMAKIAILDLEKCIEKANKTIIMNTKQQTNNDDEPEWIEVVCDLFLHLLSQNENYLRNIVNSVFPQLCENLTLTAIHQILTVLDMKDGKNPLCDQPDDDDDDENNDTKVMIEDGNESTDDNDNDDDDDDDDDEEEDDEEESLMDEQEEEDDGTVTDKLRNALSTALGGGTKESDLESIDLNDMDEEEGQRLNEALSIAFQAMKKSDNENKRSKGYRIKTTTIMHFRIRVLDLIEIYLQQNPTLLITLEIMIALFSMIEYCVDKELKPLSIKLDKVLTKLTNLRQFSTLEDVNVENISSYLRLIIEKKVQSSAFEAHNKFKTKCCIFLIANWKQLQTKNSEIKLIQLLNEYINDFIKSRNPILTITLLNEIFKMRWQGIWKLATTLIQNGLNDETRTFRRIQIIGLLDVLYKNKELIREHENSIKLIEISIEKHLCALSEKVEQISAREFCTILNVLFFANRAHQKLSLETNFNLNLINTYVQKIRQNIKLDSLHSYTRYCNVFGLKIYKNCDLQLNGKSIKKINCKITDNSIEEQKNENGIKVNKNKRKLQENEDEIKEIDKSKLKKTNTITNQRKEKKIKKEKRLKTISEGLNGHFSFNGIPVDVNMPDGELTD